MKSLSSYIKENQKTSLPEYIVNEGLLNWLKKIWNKMFKSAKDNINTNGYYAMSQDTMSAVENNQEIEGGVKFGEFKKQSDFLSYCKNINKVNKDKAQVNIIQFEDAVNYCENEYKGNLIFPCNDDKDITIAFIFCKGDKENRIIDIEKIIFSKSIIDAAEDITTQKIPKQVTREFNKFIKEHNAKLNPEVKTSVILVPKK